jgi:hypothetical protein
MFRRPPGLIDRLRKPAVGVSGQVYLALLFGIAGQVAFAAAVLVGLQIATNARKPSLREFAGVVVMASIALAMILWQRRSRNR